MEQAQPKQTSEPVAPKLPAGLQPLPAPPTTRKNGAEVFAMRMAQCLDCKQKRSLQRLTKGKCFQCAFKNKRQQTRPKVESKPNDFLDILPPTHQSGLSKAPEKEDKKQEKKEYTRITARHQENKSFRVPSGESSDKPARFSTVIKKEQMSFPQNSNSKEKEVPSRPNLDISPKESLFKGTSISPIETPKKDTDSPPRKNDSKPFQAKFQFARNEEKRDSQKKKEKESRYEPRDTKDVLSRLEGKDSKQVNRLKESKDPSRYEPKNKQAFARFQPRQAKENSRYEKEFNRPQQNQSREYSRPQVKDPLSPLLKLDSKDAKQLSKYQSRYSSNQPPKDFRPDPVKYQSPKMQRSRHDSKKYEMPKAQPQKSQISSRYEPKSYQHKFQTQLAPPPIKFQSQSFQPQHFEYQQPQTNKYQSSLNKYSDKKQIKRDFPIHTNLAKSNIKEVNDLRPINESFSPHITPKYERQEPLYQNEPVRHNSPRYESDYQPQPRQIRDLHKSYQIQVDPYNNNRERTPPPFNTKHSIQPNRSSHSKTPLHYSTIDNSQRKYDQEYTPQPYLENRKTSDYAPPANFYNQNTWQQRTQFTHLKPDFAPQRTLAHSPRYIPHSSNNYVSGRRDATPKRYYQEQQNQYTSPHRNTQDQYFDNTGWRNQARNSRQRPSNFMRVRNSSKDFFKRERHPRINNQYFSPRQDKKRYAPGLLHQRQSQKAINILTPYRQDMMCRGGMRTRGWPVARWEQQSRSRSGWTRNYGRMV